MIDVREEAQAFYPIDISALPLDDERYTEPVRLAFALYNKALQKIESGYEDLARIDLKKAVSLYPGFSEAIMLLGICTFANGDRIGAVRIFNSVKDPAYREKSMAYLDHLADIAEKAGTNSVHMTRAEEHLNNIMGTDGRQQKPPAARQGNDEISAERVSHAGVSAEQTVPHAFSAGSESIVFSGIHNDPEEMTVQSGSGIFDAGQEPVPIAASKSAEDGSAAAADSGPDADLDADMDILIDRFRRRPAAAEKSERDDSPAHGPESEVAPRKAAPFISGSADAGHMQAARKKTVSSGSGRDAAHTSSTESASRESIAGGNKRFLIIAVMILLLFVVVISVVAVNLSAENRRLKQQLERPADGSLSSAAPSGEKPEATPDASGALPADPTGMPDSEEAQHRYAEELYAQAKQLYLFRNYYSVVELLYDFMQEDGTRYLSADKKTELTSLYTDSQQLFAKANYGMLFEYEKQEEYEKVIELLLPVYRYYNDYAEMSMVLFYLGKAYELLGDQTNSQKYYQECVDRFPDSQAGGWSRWKLTAY